MTRPPTKQPTLRAANVVQRLFAQATGMFSGFCMFGWLSTTAPPRLINNNDGGLRLVLCSAEVAGPRMAYWQPRAVLFIDSFEYNDLTEFEGAEDFLVRWPIAGKNHADR